MKEFVAEIVSIGRVRHRNLVQLLGYSRRRGSCCSSTTTCRTGASTGTSSTGPRCCSGGARGSGRSRGSRRGSCTCTRSGSRWSSTGTSRPATCCWTATSTPARGLRPREALRPREQRTGHPRRRDAGLHRPGAVEEGEGDGELRRVRVRRVRTGGRVREEAVRDQAVRGGDGPRGVGAGVFEAGGDRGGEGPEAQGRLRGGGDGAGAEARPALLAPGGDLSAEHEAGGAVLERGCSGARLVGGGCAGLRLHESEQDQRVMPLRRL
ncbi:L-type lectin-domain containing receptor kinase IV.1-like [Iris pallida]|uniref:L-type lectin-domain containing receptor kinase IV.1-like n=1 Tax=Iris pallida TaxID=29817 RepID=A0AAX6IJN3_IRIPA|nr:L-type lectin-domain containing receptor kinase IV.1-like [Iris pallida]